MHTFVVLNICCVVHNYRIRNSDYICYFNTQCTSPYVEGKREGRRDGWMEGGEVGREGGREGGTDVGREGWR